LFDHIATVYIIQDPEALRATYAYDRNTSDSRRSAYCTNCIELGLHLGKANAVAVFDSSDSRVTFEASKNRRKDMSVLVNKDSKVIVQGFTGSEGTFHAEQMIAYGTQVVGGVTPGKGGQTHLDRPVFNTVKEAVVNTGADVSILFVPPAFAADAIMEAAEAGIRVIVAITEGIPVADMAKAKAYIGDFDCTLIGPNCPGVITAEECKVGIMPGFIFKKGRVGVVSKSGTLTYEAADQIVKAGMGITTAIGIGGDPIIGTTTLEAVKLFMEDSETDGIVMIGEIGGDLEVKAARWIQENGTKPVVGFIAGETAPKGRTMGHAGAIVSGEEESAQAKKQIMRECGLEVVDSPAHIGQKMAEALGITA
jgi:succinyl-CoA synthetase alpha subunit